MGEEDKAGAKHQFVATSPEYVSFGYDRHSWYGWLSSTAIHPRVNFFCLFVVSSGRFFAGAALETMLAHVVTMYDKYQARREYDSPTEFAYRVLDWSRLHGRGDV